MKAGYEVGKMMMGIRVFDRAIQKVRYVGV